MPAASTPSGVSLEAPKKHILYVDAYDSFSFNVVSMLEDSLPVHVSVIHVDSEWPNGDILGFLRNFDAVVLGPGPGNPNNAKDVGIMKDIWTLDEANIIPVFGICLGYQSLCLHHGVPIQRLPYPIHGQVRRVTTAKYDIFEGVPDFEVTLYHSLCAKWDISPSQLPPAGDGHEKRFNSSLELDNLTWLAWLLLELPGSSDSQVVPMAVRHNEKPFWGVQFHPESCKSDSQACSAFLRHWWKAAIEFNERSGRVTKYVSSNVNERLEPVSWAIPEITSLMEEWSAASSSKSASRSMPLHSLTAEKVFEIMNDPGSESVLFRSSGRYNIMSVLSPSSWRLEYHVPNETLSMEKLGTSGLPSGKQQESVSSVLRVSQFWDALRHLMETKKVSSGNGDVQFWGGFLGYFSYEMGLAGLHYSESEDISTSLSSPEHSSTDFTQEHAPDVSLLWVERSVVIDSKTGRLYLQSTRESDDLPGGWLDVALNRLESVVNTLSPDSAATTVSQGQLDITNKEYMDSIFSGSVLEWPNEDTYKEQIETCQSLLRAGESYELCLTCETSVTLQAAQDEATRRLRPWLLFKRLQKYNPAIYSSYARLGNVKVASSSPECFLNWDRNYSLEMKPMKGTVKKSEGMTLEIAKEILSTTKEMAENLMIADLIRHDLYGMCGSGNVRVEKLLEVEDHARVYQMITHVVGDVDPQHLGAAVRHMPQLKSPHMSVHGITALQRSLPPGSMTGAPKDRSCMHLELIEKRKRGVYSGAMGYLDLGGAGSFSVLIRTLFSYSDDASPQLWRAGAGGAVTILSTAEGEWEEMMVKVQTVADIFKPEEC